MFRRSLFHSQRVRYFFVVSITLLPLASFLLVVFLVFLHPIFTSLERAVHIGYQEIRPIRKLQIALLKAVMPPNDFLIHGDVTEKSNWIIGQREVDTAFDLLQQVDFSAGERELIAALRKRWERSVRKGDTLFLDEDGAHLQGGSAALMEIFDAEVEFISDQLSILARGVEQEIIIEHNRVERLKPKVITFTIISIFLGLLLGLMASVWLTRTRREMLDLTRNDPLTGVLNRRALDEALNAAHEYWVLHRSCYSVLMMDIDHFKSVNDQYGHDAGDIALKTVVGAAKAISRRDDIFGRYGGEEFLMLLPGTGSMEATMLAERVRSAIETTPALLPEKRGQLSLTVSIGCVTCKDATDSLQDVLRRVDEAMYKAKASGRNQIMRGS